MTVDLDRDIFMRTLIRKLAGSLESVVGLHEASRYVSIVGTELGDDLNRAYTEERGTERMTQAQVTATLSDLKRRINGDFLVLEEDGAPDHARQSRLPLRRRGAGAAVDVHDDLERVGIHRGAEPRLCARDAEGNHRGRRCGAPGRHRPATGREGRP
jgi:hypothetical protein